MKTDYEKFKEANKRAAEAEKSQKPSAMDANESVTVLCAVRYAIGRASYAPGCVIDHLLANKERITKKMIDNIEKDLEGLIKQEGSIPYFDEWINCINLLSQVHERKRD